MSDAHERFLTITLSYLPLGCMRSIEYVRKGMFVFMAQEMIRSHN